mmetsp:Transcript_11473/g.28381  ORF Transcript_11473/g.28381 Transcript_11473/m.28381 type:complete len:290 (+) Transcript_11473:159-1028(+)
MVRRLHPGRPRASGGGYAGVQAAHGDAAASVARLVVRREQAGVRRRAAAPRQPRARPRARDEWRGERVRVVPRQLHHLHRVRLLHPVGRDEALPVRRRSLPAASARERRVRHAPLVAAVRRAAARVGRPLCRREDDHARRADRAAARPARPAGGGGGAAAAPPPARRAAARDGRRASAAQRALLLGGRQPGDAPLRQRAGRRGARRRRMAALQLALPREQLHLACRRRLERGRRPRASRAAHLVSPQFGQRGVAQHRSVLRPSSCWPRSKLRHPSFSKCSLALFSQSCE